MTWIHASQPKSCQDRKVAIRDACGRRGLRSPGLRERETAMPGFGDIVQKAFYLGVGLASAGEKQVENWENCDRKPKSWQ